MENKYEWNLTIIFKDMNEFEEYIICSIHISFHFVTCFLVKHCYRYFFKEFSY